VTVSTFLPFFIHPTNSDDRDCVRHDLPVKANQVFQDSPTGDNLSSLGRRQPRTAPVTRLKRAMIILWDLVFIVRFSSVQGAIRL
jgi:hypothetical protein